MFFTLSKVLYFVLQPSSLMLVTIGAGLLVAIATRHVRRGLRIAVAGLAAFVVAGLAPVGNWAVFPLEQRFAGLASPTAADRPAGIILLGGFEDGWVSAGRGRLALNEAGERLTEGLLLARRLDGVPLIFTGGVGSLIAADPDAARPVGAFLADAGIAPARIVLESRSRNTHENALLTRDLVKPQPGQRFVLVTSAYHMPRAVGVFRKAGFDVIPYPVDYRTHGTADLGRVFDRVPAGIDRLDLAAREWMGLVAYWASGRTSALFPAP